MTAPQPEPLSADDVNAIAEAGVAWCDEELFERILGTIRAQAAEIERLAARVAELEGVRSQLLDFYRLEVAEQPYDGLGCEAWENAVAAGCLVKVPGGFSPEWHEDNDWGAEPGDDWYETSPEIRAALAEGEG